MSRARWTRTTTTNRHALRTAARIRPVRFPGTKAELLAHLHDDHGLDYFGSITRAELEAHHADEHAPYVPTHLHTVNGIDRYEVTHR